MDVRSPWAARFDDAVDGAPPNIGSPTGRPCAETSQSSRRHQLLAASGQCLTAHGDWSSEAGGLRGDRSTHHREHCLELIDVQNLVSVLSCRGLRGYFRLRSRL